MLCAFGVRGQEVRELSLEEALAIATATSEDLAIARAGRIRLRPILMTSLALIAGMIPVAMGIGEGDSAPPWAARSSAAS